jgi:hypothetical protein
VVLARRWSGVIENGEQALFVQGIPPISPPLQMEQQEFLQEALSL